MSSTETTSGFVYFLLCIAVVQSRDDWGVTYTSTQICAVKGSTVEINCTYRHPQKSTETGLDITVERTFWFTRINEIPIDLTTKEEYAGRVQHSCQQKSCTLRITDLRESDSATYKFRFITDKPGGSYIGEPGVTLSVTDLKVRISNNKKNYQNYLECYNTCSSPFSSTYVWYKNGHKIVGVTSLYSDRFEKKDSISCALRENEDFPSLPSCQSCNTVIYSSRRICAFKGSAVKIESTYNSQESVTSKFWFSPGRSHQWWDHSQPGNLEQDSQYEGRIHISDRWASWSSWSSRSKRFSTLTISDLRENDSAEYRFKFKTSQFQWGNDLHGTTLTVAALQVQVTRISVSENYVYVQLKCHSSCSPPGQHSYIWFKNGEKIYQRTFSYEDQIYPADKISCAVQPYEQHCSAAVYAPDSVSASVSPSGVMMEGTSVTLTCSSDANPAASYTWYKHITSEVQPVGKDMQLIFNSVQPSDSGGYYCEAKNELGRGRSVDVLVDVKYAPKLPSVSVSPSAVMMEGTSVTLTCSSDANPAANYTWYKTNQKRLHGPKGIYVFTSINVNDSGIYYCQSDNKYGRINSSTVHIDIQYAPKPPSVSVSPPGEIEEGTSVTLTCSSDANPAANYTWYKEDEASPKASGELFMIVNITSQHSGNYYCEAWNSWGHQNSTSTPLIVVSSSTRSAAVGSISAILLAVIFLSAFIFVRRKRLSKQTSQSRERSDNDPEPNMAPDYENVSTPGFRKQTEEVDDVQYGSVRFHKNQEDLLYDNIMPTKPEKQKDGEPEEDLVYTLVKFTNNKPR